MSRRNQKHRREARYVAAVCRQLADDIRTRVRYRVEFTRIGRSHNVPPLTTEADDPGDLAVKIHRYARPFLASRDVEVAVDLTDGTGDIWCGYQSGGKFTVTEVTS